MSVLDLADDKDVIEMTEDTSKSENPASDPLHKGVEGTAQGDV